MSRTDLIESRIDKDVTAHLPMTSMGVMFQSMGEIMEFAKMMAVSGAAVPLVFRDNPGACLAVAIKAHHLGFEPFSFASKCYLVTNKSGDQGTLAYEAQLINAIIVRRAGFVKRPTVTFTGDGLKRACQVILHLPEPDGDMVYLSPPYERITPKNSPLWTTDPDQQLAYYSVRAAARRFVPDVILGMYDPEEAAQIAMKEINERPVSDIGARLAEAKKVEPVYMAASPKRVEGVVTVEASGETSPAAASGGTTDGPTGLAVPVEATTPAGEAAEAAHWQADGDVATSLEKALAECKTPTDVWVVADEYAGAILLLKGNEPVRLQDLIKARAEALE